MYTKLDHDTDINKPLQKHNYSGTILYTGAHTNRYPVYIYPPAAVHTGKNVYIIASDSL